MDNKKQASRPLREQIDWPAAVIPFALILFLFISFTAFPESSKKLLEWIRFLLGDTLGLYYLVIGLGIFLLSLYLIRGYPSRKAGRKAKIFRLHMGQHDVYRRSGRRHPLLLPL